ncbi:hypothetical protein WMZ97_11625 [Lentibacillus sp. N15]|uniref:hypothetical protein n=1 Tax=Lentibacillus songyuanensis TaxID=3136161 RepID=UPI0031BA9A3C
MSDNDVFLEEKLKIDDLMKRGYTISKMVGTLDGDVFEFEHQTEPSKKETLLLTNPDSRKYVTTLYIKEKVQRKKVKN